MDNYSTDSQMQLQALAHEVCRSHSARPERDLYRICPSKLSKRELEDLYFALLESNLELKRTINSQNEKLKMLSTKVQRLSANRAPGSKDKDCCNSKALINEHKDSITELRKCNERMAERIRVLNMRLCSAKQFLKKQPPEQKTGTKSQLKNGTNFQNFKKVCDHSKPHQAAIEYKISKSVETSTDNPLVTPRKEKDHECDENKCKTAIEELQQKIKELQEELHHTQLKYASKLHDLENEIRSVMEEKVRARADTLAAEERGDLLVDRLRAAEGRGDDLETQLAIEKRKVKELETRLKLADNDMNLAKSLDQLTVINEQRDPDESSQPSYKFRPRQSVTEPPKLQEYTIELEKNELEEGTPIPASKSEQRESIVPIKETKPRQSKIEPEFQKNELKEGTLISSSKSERRESIVSVKEPPKLQEYTIEPEKNELEEGTPIPASKSEQRESIVSIKETEPRQSKFEPEFQKNELEEGSPIPSSKGKRRESIVSVKVTQPRESETKSEFSPILSHKPHRKESPPTVKLEVPSPKLSYEVKFSKSDDSGYTDPNKSYDEPEKDEEMLRINRDLLKKIADLKSQLDLLMIAAAGIKQDEPPPAELMETIPSAADKRIMENDNSVPTKSLSTHSTKVPNEIEPQQKVQAKTEDKIKNTPSSVKPEVVHNLGQLPNDGNLPKHVPNEEKEQKPSSYKDHADNFFAPNNLLSPLEKNKPLADENTHIRNEDEMEGPISYEIQVPRSSLYPELAQKVPQHSEKVKPQTQKERDSITSTYDNKVPSTTQGIIQDHPLIRETMLSSYDIIAQKPLPSDEKILMPSSENANQASNTFEEKTSMSSYEDTSKNLPYRERLSMSSDVNKAQNRPQLPFEYDVMPGEKKLPSYHPYEYKPRKSSVVEKNQDPPSYEGTIHKSQLHDDKKLFPEDKNKYKEYADKKRELLFYKDEVPNVDQNGESVLNDDKGHTPNVNRKNDSYYELHRSNLPYEDKIYPDDQKFNDGTITPDENVRTMQEQFVEKRNPSLYAERIEKFSLEEHAPTTSSPYEEKMQKLHDEKLQTNPPEDEKSLRFESYIHMADSGSKDYGPQFPKYQDTAEDDPSNVPQVNRKRSSTIGTSGTDDHYGFQIPGPIPSVANPTPIDRKKRISFDKRKRSSEEKTVTILEDQKEPSGYSIYFDKSSISKNESGSRTDLVDDEKKYRKESKPRVSIDFSQITDSSKEKKDLSYNNKNLQVDSYSDVVWQRNIPSSAMQEQVTQTDQKIEWCVAGARVCTCPPGALVTAPLRTCSGTKRPAPPHMRYCACCNDKILQTATVQPRRDSATYTKSDQPQTYTVPKDAYTQPRRDTMDKKTYTQNGTFEYPQLKTYKRDTPTYSQDTFTQGGQSARAQRYSRSTSPDSTDKEISSLPDLPHEREIKSTNGYLSPGEKATMTFTDNETNTDYGTLSEGELPGTKKTSKTFGEKGVETSSGPVESTSQRMEAVLKAISEELSRCHRLLEGQKQDQLNTREVTKPVEDEGVQLRASQGARRLTGTHHVCVFTLHVGTLVLSDEAVLQSRDKSLVLTWRFYDQSVTMTRMRAGRVFVFDFSTEYDIVFCEDFINYMKFEKMPLLICEISKQDKPFATCSLPLRDALLHVNRRADMSLALTSGPGGDPESSSEELGVLDLWCILRCDAVITQHLIKSLARTSSNMGGRYSFHNSIGAEEDLSNERLSEDLDLKMKNQNRMPLNNKKSYSGYFPVADEVPHQGETTVAADSDRKDVSFDGPSNWATSKFPMHPSATGLIANAVPSNIRSTEEMKAALERNAIQEETRKLSKPDDKLLSRKNQLTKLKFTNKLSEDVNIGSLQDLISNRESASDRNKNSLPKYDLAPITKPENELAKKYNDITKLMVSRQDAAKKSVKYSDDDEPQRGTGQEGPLPQSIEITVLWLALNEECDAMVNPNIKRLYVAYKFLGRNGAELETPVSLPKPKHYVDKCYFNFKKTFHLHDADLPALGHMARVRAGSRVSTDPRDCLIFSVVSEPPEDPLGLSSCEDVGYAYLYLGDILAYSSGAGAYTEVVAVHTARGSAVCGVLAVKVDGLNVLRRALSLSHSPKDLEHPVMAY